MHPVTKKILDESRNVKGQFQVGNVVDNDARRVSQRRSELASKRRLAFLREISSNDIRAAARKLCEMAADGDLDAIKELLDRTLGKTPRAEKKQVSEGIRIVVVGDDAFNKRFGSDPESTPAPDGFIDE